MGVQLLGKWLMGLAVLAALAGFVVAGAPAGAAASVTGDLAVAARTIGISEAALRSAVAGGKTIAAVAQSRGIAPQAVIDAVVRSAVASAQSSPEWAKRAASEQGRFVEQTRARVTAWVYGTAAGDVRQQAKAPVVAAEAVVAARVIGVTSE
ncbi:MAG TPA: hypothetical protein VM536_00470, partial [Chloroflexia bacterium]|nr:hypothetical protein [Chloroflexia bacterium]